MQTVRGNYLSVLVALTLPVTGMAQDDSVLISAGDNAALIDAIDQANAGTGPGLIFVQSGFEDVSAFVFDLPTQGINSALPEILVDVDIRAVDGGNFSFERDIDASASFRFAQVGETGQLRLEGFDIRRFSAPNGDGGALFITEQGVLILEGTRFFDNTAELNGGAVALKNRSRLEADNVEFWNNQAGRNGGALSIQGGATGQFNRGIFLGNSAGEKGCDLNVDSIGSRFEVTLNLDNSVLQSNCDGASIDNATGVILSRGNTVVHPTVGINSTDRVRLFGSLLEVGELPAESPQRALASSHGRHIARPQAACEDEGLVAYQSEGHNLSTDSSCSLDQDTDLPATDPIMFDGPDGIRIPGPLSPALDAGSAEVYTSFNNPFAALPCGYVDALGSARPQDANEDGVFECDIGAIELVGPGTVSSGHSGAFFNPAREGEGNYVEILDDNTAIVYTFTYRPDGTGPAWFTGIGEIRGNSIVIDDLRRPVGTSFGEDFDAQAIDYSPAGGMSMVFPTCGAGNGGGGVAYSGNIDIGYEGVLSRAERITAITGCAATPAANAGLSGSWFDPARNGEGLIIQWLENGDVLAIFFTFDLDGNQFWVFGSGTPSGTSVTINALYPAASSAWGSTFDPSEVDLQSWGTFTLNWSDCDSMTFDYDSNVAGFGAASRSYIRVSLLQDTTCPEFP